MKTKKKERGCIWGRFVDFQRLGRLYSGKLLLVYKALSTLIAVWLFMVRSPHSQDSWVHGVIISICLQWDRTFKQTWIWSVEQQYVFNLQTNKVHSLLLRWTLSICIHIHIHTYQKNRIFFYINWSENRILTSSKYKGQSFNIMCLK